MDVYNQGEIKSERERKQTKCHGQTINVYYNQNKNTLEWEK